MKKRKNNKKIKNSKKIKVPYLDLRVHDSNLKQNLLNRFEKIIDHGKIILGPEQIEFERRIAKEIGTKYALGVSSGSSALYLALNSLGIREGDESRPDFDWITPCECRSRYWTRILCSMRRRRLE